MRFFIIIALFTCASLLAGCTEQAERPTEGYLEVAPGVEIYFERVGDVGAERGGCRKVQRRQGVQRGEQT